MRPVVLLGGINVVRAFGMAKIPVIVASSERRTPSMASRHCAGVIELPPITERAAVADALARAGRRLAQAHGGPLPLFYDNEDRLRLVQDYREMLAAHFALLLNHPALDAALLDKSRFQALGERLALPLPRRIAWEALDAERGPVLAKPFIKSAAWGESAAQRRFFGETGKARIFASGAAARADPLARELSGELTFQEYVPGGDDAIWSFHGFAAPGGEVLEWFVGRKIRTSPPLTGESSYVRLARSDELVRLGRDAAAKLGLAGVFKMDFKRDPASGRFHLFEVNTRVNLWTYVGAVNGVNLARVAYDWLLGGTRPRHVEARLALRWLAFRLDWPAFQALRARGELGLAGWLWSLVQSPTVYELFSWNDPLPFARFWATRLRAALARRMQRWLATAS